MILDNYAEYLINNQDYAGAVRRVYRFKNGYGVVVTKYPPNKSFSLKPIQFDNDGMQGRYYGIKLVENADEKGIEKMFKEVMEL